MSGVEGWGLGGVRSSGPADQELAGILELMSDITEGSKQGSVK